MNPTEHGNERAAAATAQVTLTLQELCNIGMALVAMNTRRVLSTGMAHLGQDCLPPYLTILSAGQMSDLIARIATVYGTTSAEALGQPVEAGEVTADNLIRHFWPAHLMELGSYNDMRLSRGGSGPGVPAGDQEHD